MYLSLKKRLKPLWMMLEINIVPLEIQYSLNSLYPQLPVSGLPIYAISGRLAATSSQPAYLARHSTTMGTGSGQISKKIQLPVRVYGECQFFLWRAKLGIHGWFVSPGVHPVPAKIRQKHPIQAVKRKSLAIVPAQALITQARRNMIGPEQGCQQVAFCKAPSGSLFQDIRGLAGGDSRLKIPAMPDVVTHPLITCLGDFNLARPPALPGGARGPARWNPANP